MSLPVIRFGIPEEEMSIGEVSEKEGLFLGHLARLGGDPCGESGSGF